ncbi:MAG: uroporphyrinogen decarboxylase [Armatimonadetes bacterium]|nr:uroporphyrinogen decarboxylase [Armatimonadota bacterium]
MNSYERTMAMVRGQPVDRLPAMPIFMTWLARQIGRPYRDYCFDHRVLVEGQRYLVERFEIDCVSVISDAWREAADCGARLIVFEDGPPACKEHVLADRATLATLRKPDPLGGGRMTDRVQAVARLHEEYAGQVPVMGWIEGPIAEACNLRGMNEFMLDLMDDPQFAGDLLDFATELAIGFARAQIEAGADLIGMGDAAASLCGPRFYEQLMLPREQHIIRAIHDSGALVRLHICGDTNGILALMGTTGADIIDLDHLVEPEAVRREMGERPVIAGNFDPVAVLLQGTPDQVRAACRRCHDAFGPRFIVNAGCEVPTHTPMANVEAMLGYVRTAGV